MSDPQSVNVSIDNFYDQMEYLSSKYKIITINQEDGEIDNPKEPLSTLASLSFSDEINGAFFGQNAILLSTKNYTLKVGDEFLIS